MDLTINVAQAALGAEIEIPTIDGKEKLRIPAGTQSGKIITLRGKGIPRLRGNGRGDQLVMVNVEIPSANHEPRTTQDCSNSLLKALGARFIHKNAVFGNN